MKPNEVPNNVPLGAGWFLRHVKTKQENQFFRHNNIDRSLLPSVCGYTGYHLSPKFRQNHFQILPFRIQSGGCFLSIQRVDFQYKFRTGCQVRNVVLIKNLYSSESSRMQKKSDFIGMNKIDMEGYNIEAVQMGDKAEFDSSAQMAYNSVLCD